MKFFKQSDHHHKVNSTARVEAYSDAFLAIIITILVLELHIPTIEDPSFWGVLRSVSDIGHELITFVFSFLTLSVFWVNHHHFFHELEKADWPLLWYNNLVLFWLALVPFTTAFLASAYRNPTVVMIYCFVLTMAALSFMLLSRHALYRSDLLDEHITDDQKKSHYIHGWIGVLGYLLATVIAPFYYPISYLLIVGMPLYYIAPRLMHDHSMHLEG